MKKFSECELCQQKAVLLIFGFASIGVYALIKKTVLTIKKIRNEYSR